MDLNFPLAHGEKTNSEVPSLNAPVILAWDVLGSFPLAGRKAHVAGRKAHTAGTVLSLPEMLRQAQGWWCRARPRTTECFWK